MKKLTWVKIVELCESQLGFELPFDPNDPMVRMKARNIEAAKMRRRANQEPQIFTLDNLVLAIAYIEKGRLNLESKSPLAIFGFVRAALEEANEAVLTRSIEDVRNEALDWEFEHELDPDSDKWMGRLTRAMGPGLLVVLKEWKDAGRGVEVNISTK